MGGPTAPTPHPISLEAEASIMVSETSGIHHVTGIVGDAQEAIEFYTGVLGLRLVTQTVNFEDILQHHLYFGDAAGTPGTVLTVFPDPYGDDGRVGRPQVESVSFLISEDSLPYWQNRLEDHDIELERRERFGDTVVQFQDPVGTHLELVARPATEIDASASSRGNTAQSPSSTHSVVSTASRHSRSIPTRRRACSRRSDSSTSPNRASASGTKPQGGERREWIS